MSKELEWCKRDTVPQYAKWQAKDGDTVITLYNSGKVVFQGRDADLSSDFWITTEKLNSGNVSVKNSSSKNSQNKKANNKDFIKPKIYYTSSIGSDGMKIISFYPIAKKVLFNPNFIKRIKEIELELIPYSIFKIVEKAMKDKFFSEKKIQNINSCFNKLINWIFAVLEFHKAIRKYTLSDYDYDILNKDEINFCIKMDNIILLYYKLNRYITKYCKDYENKSKMLMKKMGIIN